MRAPLAPPRLSVIRKLAADAHAVSTRSAVPRPVAIICFFQVCDVCFINYRVIQSRNRVLPNQRLLGHLTAQITGSWPISRCVNLNQALANACSNSCGLFRKRLDILSYDGSALRAISEVNMIGACRLPGMCASGTKCAATPFAGIH